MPFAIPFYNRCEFVMHCGNLLIPPNQPYAWSLLEQMVLVHYLTARSSGRGQSGSAATVVRQWQSA